MIKTFFSMTLSALIIFSSSYADAAPRRQDDRSQHARARLAAMADARRQERPAHEISSAEMDIAFKAFKKIAGLEMPALAENYEQLARGTNIDFNISAIQSLILSDANTYRDDTEKLLDFLDSRTSDSVFASNPLYDQTERLSITLRPVLRENLDDRLAITFNLSSKEKLDEILSTPSNLLNNMQKDSINFHYILQKLNINLDMFDDCFSGLSHFPLPELEVWPIEQWNEIQELLQFPLGAAENLIGKLSVSYSFQKTTFPFACAIAALSPNNKQLSDFIFTLRALYCDYTKITAEFERCMNSYNYFIQLKHKREKSGEGVVADIAQHIDRSQQKSDNAARIAATQSNKEFLAVRAAARTAVDQLLGQKNARSSKSKRRGGRRSIVAAIQTQQELHRLQEQVAAHPASASSSAAATANMSPTTAPQALTNVDAYRNWFYGSHLQFENTAKREALAQAKEQERRAQRKAQRKAAKSHEVDLEKSSGSAGVGTARSSSSDETPEEHVPVTYLDKAPWSRFQAIFEEADREFTMDEVASVIKALNGYVDPKRAGSRVKIALQNLQTGHKHTRVIHDHLSNGHKGLEAGRMSSVRELFIEAGYTPDTVLCSSDSSKAGEVSAGAAGTTDSDGEPTSGKEELE